MVRFKVVKKLIKNQDPLKNVSKQLRNTYLVERIEGEDEVMSKLHAAAMAQTETTSLSSFKQKQKQTNKYRKQTYNKKDIQLFRL